MPYKRVLLKLSGEALMGSLKSGFEQEMCHKIAKAIKEVHVRGVQIGLVIGGGNIFRGSLAESFGFARTPADHVGMLATQINGLILQQALAACGVESHVMSAFSAGSFVEPYHWQKAMDYLQRGKIVIFVGGTGNPYFTTDTAAALRASEIDADILLKATKVDGIYDKDPLKYKGAKRYEALTYSAALQENLGVMDGAAIALCRENKIPIYVFNLFEEGSLSKAVFDKVGGTLVREE